MSYKLYAKRGPKVIAIPIEEKHKYFNADGFLTWNPYDSTQINEYATSYNFSTIHSSNALTLTRGVDAGQMIGDKINLRSIDYTIAITLNSAAITDEIPHGDAIDLWVRCRLMVVHFDKSMSNANFAAWFKNNYIYYYLVGDDSTKPAQSVHQNRLRESTTDTGKFKILYDLPFKLSKQESSKELSFSLKPNMNLTFDTSGYATNDDFTNTYCFLIGPINYYFDVDARSSEMLMRPSFTSSSLRLLTYWSNVKYTFYDLN